MFRRSGPGHMLLLTVQNKIVQDQISLSLAKVKVKFGTKGQRKGKKLSPSGATQIPPNTSLPSIVLMAPPCRVKTPPWPSPPEPDLDLVVAARIEDTSSLVNKTVKMPTLPPSGWPWLLWFTRLALAVTLRRLLLAAS